jgi:hypothetical protein
VPLLHVVPASHRLHKILGFLNSVDNAGSRSSAQINRSFGGGKDSGAPPNTQNPQKYGIFLGETDPVTKNFG